MHSKEAQAGQEPQPKNRTRFPDFLGIGTTRGGSSWLYSVLSRHPDIWMPPVKELHYFDKPRNGERTLGVVPKRQIAVRLRDYLNGERTHTTGDSLLGTLAWDYHYFLRRRSLSWYEGLFRPGEAQICGEITPAYAIIPESTIAEIHSLNPQIKALYILRNPVERAWSNIVNALARKKGRSISQVPQAEILHKAQAMRDEPRTDYMGTVRRWSAVIGPERLFVGYMEEIREAPEQLYRRICAFLEVPPGDKAAAASLQGRTNSSAKHGGAGMPPEIRLLLTQTLMPVIEECAESLGGYAGAWLAEARDTVAHRPLPPRQSTL